MNTMRKLLVDIAMRFRGPWRIPRAPLPKPRYQVLVDDNFHYMDVEKRWDKGTYATLEEALRVCRAMVQRSVEEQFEQAPGATAEKLFNRYRSFGDDPFIRVLDGSDDRARFSAWTYAQEYCRTIYDKRR